jgi:crotonobetainyl-CoA:carnitine CoA-transferase CaiB-like acyl-CoA transferase
MGLTNALDGCRVLEVSGDAAVAYCTKVLGELGAEIIKVEPRTGDPIRRLGSAAPGQDGPLFIYANTGKRSVVADPTSWLATRASTT